MENRFVFSIVAFAFILLVGLVSAGVIIESPEDGGNYTGNVSLNYSVVGSGECWYNLNGGENVSLISCGNSTLSLGDGNYTLEVYYNDSFGNLSVNSSIFSISLEENMSVLEWFKGNESDFDLGSYQNLDFDLGSLSLVGENLTGLYISEVFDSGEDSLWANISYVVERPYGENLKANESSEEGMGGFDMDDNILLYHFDDLLGFDYSGNGNDALVFGGPGLGQGRFGASLDLDGEDYLEGEHSNSLNIASAMFSVSVWVKTEEGGQIIYKEGYSGNDYYGLKIDGDKAVFEFSSGNEDSTINAISVSNVSDGEWHHIVGVRDSTKRGLIYVDGVLEDSDTYGGSLGSADTDDVFLVGSRMGSNIYVGELDELAIWRRILSVGDVENLYERGAVSLGLIGRACDDQECSGEDFEEIREEINVSGRYFQYGINFSSLDSSLGDLFNVSVSYLYGSGDSGSGDSGGDNGGGGSSGGGSSGGSGGSGGGSGGSGGGSGGSGSIVRSASTIRVAFNEIGDNVFKRGERSELIVEVQNQEIKFLNKCSLRGEGLVQSWVSGSEIKGLSAGEKFEYVLDMEVPGVLDPGSYRADLVLECDEGIAEYSLDFNVYRNRLEVIIEDYERVGGELRVNYSLIDNLGEEQILILSYSLLDFDNVTRTSGSEEVVLEAGGKQDFVLEFDLPKDSFGEFSLVLGASNSVVSGENREEVFLPSVGFTGLFISDLTGGNLSLIGVVFLIVLALAIVGWLIYLVSVKIRRRKGQLGRVGEVPGKVKRVKLKGR